MIDSGYLNLTREEASAVADFIGTELFTCIRKDADINNINWLVILVQAYNKLKIFGDND